MRTTEGEIAYPQFYVSASWIEDGAHEDPEHYSVRGLPVGRRRNSTGCRRMFREPIILGVLERERRDEWWPEFLKNQGDEITNPKHLHVSIEAKGYETWCPGWFSHWTFLAGQSDAEAIESFERFVSRMERLNRLGPSFTVCLSSDKGYLSGDNYCLMGAEDRYRWTARANGTTLIGCGDSTGKAPCRCEHCVKEGILRIDH